MLVVIFFSYFSNCFPSNSCNAITTPTSEGQKLTSRGKLVRNIKNVGAIIGKPISWVLNARRKTFAVLTNGKENLKGKMLIFLIRARQRIYWKYTVFLYQSLLRIQIGVMLGLSMRSLDLDTFRSVLAACIASHATAFITLVSPHRSAIDPLLASILICAALSYDTQLELFLFLFEVFKLSFLSNYFANLPIPSPPQSSFHDFWKLLAKGVVVTNWTLFIRKLLAEEIGPSVQAFSCFFSSTFWAVLFLAVISGILLRSLSALVEVAAYALFLCALKDAYFQSRLGYTPEAWWSISVALILVTLPAAAFILLAPSDILHSKSSSVKVAAGQMDAQSNSIPVLQFPDWLILLTAIASPIVTALAIFVLKGARKKLLHFSHT